MSKLLVNASNEATSKIITANPLDYVRFVDELTNWLGIRFEIVGTNRYTLDMHHEQAYQAKVRGAREVGQIIVESWGMSIYETIHGWSDDKLINWLESHGYTWDTNLMGWVIHVQP